MVMHPVVNLLCDPDGAGLNLELPGRAQTLLQILSLSPVGDTSVLSLSSSMADGVYASTTTPNPSSSFCLVPSEHLEKPRFILKVLEVVSSKMLSVLPHLLTHHHCISTYSGAPGASI